MPLRVRPISDAQIPSLSPCIGGEAHLACSPWHRERQYPSRDFGTAGTCRRPRIAHSRHSPEAAPPEAAFVFQVLGTERRRVRSGLSQKEVRRCPTVISMSSPALRWRSDAPRYLRSPTNPQTRSRPLNRTRPGKRAWRGSAADFRKPCAGRSENRHNRPGVSNRRRV